MRHGDQRFAIRTVPGEGASDDIRLDIAGLNIGSALGLLPSAPPVDGILGTDMTLGMTPDSLTLRGDYPSRSCRTTNGGSATSTSDSITSRIRDIWPMRG